jgi:hypothetical protein
MPLPTRLRARLSITTAILTAALAASTVQADPLPTMDEMRQMLKDEKFKEMSPLLARALSLKGPDAEQYPKRDLYELKGEVSLHTKAKGAAADAFTSAAKATDKPDEAAADLGVAMLIKASAGTLKYTPKTKADKADKPEPIDIVDPDSRKKALAALAKDMLTARQPKVDAAMKSTNFAQINAAGKDLADVKAVEIAQTGAVGDSKQVMGDLGNHATKLIGDAMDGMSQKLQDELDAYQKAASGKSAGAGQSQRSVSLSSLGRDAQTTANNAKALGQEAQLLSTTFGDVADFHLIETKSKQLAAGADRLLASVKQAGG